MTTQRDELLNHEYDGIREYDNPTPGWWHFIFMTTVLFSFLYLFFFHMSPLSWSVHDQWRSAQVAEYERIFGEIGDLNADEQTVVDMMQNAQMMAVARGMFEGNCASCHAKNGGGINGANLTDDVYLNVKSIMDVYTVITDGAKFGAMPAWGERLNQNERVLLSSFVANLRGTNAPGGRGPEGEPIAAWPTPTR